MLFLQAGGCKQRKDRVMKKSTLLSVVIAMTTVAAADVAYAAVPPVDRAGRPALSVCPAGPPGRIFHFDKVIFQLSPGNLLPIIAADAVALNALPRNADLDIKINDDPRTVAVLESKVLSFLGARNNVANRTSSEFRTSNIRRSSARKDITPPSTTSSCCRGRSSRRLIVLSARRSASRW